jgi:hypothetical protein
MMVWLNIPKSHLKFEIILKAMIYWIIFQRNNRFKIFSLEVIIFYGDNLWNFWFALMCVSIIIR